jgi:uncharacterized repeat protein (TIGR01451 family)
MQAHKQFRMVSILALLLGALLLVAMLPNYTAQVSAGKAAKPLRTDWCGLLTNDTTWDAASGPHVVTCDVTVGPTATLTIEPEAVVKFIGATRLIVDGQLVAAGSDTQSIIFTSYKDDAAGGDTNGDGSASSPQKGDWGKLVINSGSNASLDYVTVRYGGSGTPSANIWVNTPNFALSNSIIEQGWQYGIIFENVLPQSFITNTLRNNYRPALANLLELEGVSAFLRGNSASGNNGATNGENGFFLKGTFSGTLTLGGDPGLPFMLDRDDFGIASGAQLTLTPGTIFKPTEGWADFFVYGTLKAVGTSDQPIYFTSLRDDTAGGDTNGDGNATVPGAGNWGSLRFGASSAHNHLDHVIARYGGGDSSGTGANLWVNTRSFTMTASDSQGAGSYGVYFENVLPSTFISNTLENNSYAAYANLVDCGDSIVLRGNSASGNTLSNGLYVKGSITGTVTWSGDPGFAFQWDRNDIVINAGSQLTLAPGTVFKAHDAWADIMVYGTLKAIGTPEEPIYFTSLLDDSAGGDTNGDGNVSQPNRGQWCSLRFMAASSASVLQNVVTSYGGGDASCTGANVWAGTSDLSVLSSTLTYGSRYDILVDGVEPIIQGNKIGESGNGVHVTGDSRLRLENNLIYNNDRGVWAANVSTPTLRNNVLIGNRYEGVQVGDSAVVDAVGNYWGASSGPYHASTNPHGEGNAVGNRVSYRPWLEYPPAGIVTLDDVIIHVQGAERISPGDTEYFGVRYLNLTANTVENAVLVFALPKAADYLASSGDGVYWPEKHVVFWNLGHWQPNTFGQMSIKVRYMWGLPLGFQDAGIALLGGTNLYTDTLDVTPYLAYSGLSAQSQTSLAEAQIETQRQARADFDALYTQALGAGYAFGAATRFQMSTGEIITQTVMLHLEQQTVRYLSLSADRALASTFDHNVFTIQDSGGGMRWDMQTDERTYWGTWGSGSGQLAAQACTGAACCVKNCMSGVIFDATIGRASKLASAAIKTRNCYQAYQKGSVLDLDFADCASGFIKNVPLLGEVIGTAKCARDCNAQPTSHDCTQDRISCKQDWRNVFSWMGVPSMRITRCKDGCYLPGDEFVPCAYGDKCVPGKGCVDCNSQGVDCVENEYYLARDPNLKFGPEGDLLPGQLITYTITYENEGAGTAYDVFVVDDLSPHFDESTLTIYGGGDYYTETRTLSWDIGELAPKGQPGSEGSISFTVRLKDDLPGGTLITNQAVVYFPSVPEETPTNMVVNTIQPLVALPQDLETEAQQTLDISLQGLEPSHLPLSYAIEDEPLYGQLEGSPPLLAYTPMTDFIGVDSFTFHVSNGITQSQPAEIHINVLPWSGDATPPEVVWVEPSSGEMITPVVSTPVMSDSFGAAYAPFITVQFSEVISEATLTHDTFQLLPAGGGQALSATIGYNGVFNQAVLIPRQALVENTTYTVTLKSGISDLNGNTLGADYAWRFIAAGAGYEPERGLEIGAPSSVIYQIPITNTGQAVDSFSITLSGNNWPASAPDTLGPIGAGETGVLQLTVGLPVTTALALADTVTITVSSAGDPAQRATLSLTTHLNPSGVGVGYKVYLPVVLKS